MTWSTFAPSDKVMLEGLPFGSPDDVSLALIVPWTYLVLKGLTTLLYVSFIDAGLPNDPNSRGTVVKSVGGVQQCGRKFYMPGRDGSQCCRGSGRNFFGVVGSAALLATVIAMLLYAINR
jgi:hypothetical protein